MNSTVNFNSATFPVTPLSVAPSSEYASLWTETLGSPEVCVAILDGMVDLEHPCLDGADLTVLRAASLTRPSNEAPSIHGTHVASIVFGQHDAAVRGIAPRCRGLVIPVFESTEDGGVLPCTQADLARAITLAVRNGANVINISGGQFEMSGEADPKLAEAVHACADHGVLLVSAAGNDGCQCLHVPAALSPVLVVGAMDASGAPMEFSNWGEAYETKGILAPGDGVIGANLGGGITSRSGTSAATPIVAGVAALLMSVQWKRDGRIKAELVRRALLETANGCEEMPVPDCRRLLAGRLNVAGALSFIKKGTGNKMPEQISRIDSIESQVAACVPPSSIAEVTPPARSSNTAPAPADNAVVVSEAPKTPIVSNGQPVVDTPQVDASECGCGGDGGKSAPALVFALGQIDFDFGSEAVRDSFEQHGVETPENRAELIAHLRENPSDASALIWTLVQESTPIYAIQPGGAFGRDAYDRLREFMTGQLNNIVGQVSIPGQIAGNVRLCNGHIVPVIHPDLRGMYSWSTAALIKAVAGEPPKDPKELPMYNQKVAELNNFLQRVYHELRNKGAEPQDRAINFAGTNAITPKGIFEYELNQGRFLKSIEAEPSPICRPGSECWDVKLTFFCPIERLTQALHSHRYTIDVSEAIPVTVGEVRSWSEF